MTGTGPKGLTLDQSLCQPQGVGRQSNGPRGCELFHAGRQVRGLADGRVVHMEIVADGPYHDLAGVEADPNLHFDPMLAAHRLAVTADGLLHGECRIAGPHRMIFMRDRRPKQGHDAIAHDLVHGAFVAVHGRHQALQHRVEELARLLGIAIGQQLHRAFEIGKEDRHLLAFPFDGALGGQDLLCQICGRIGNEVALIGGHPWPGNMCRCSGPGSYQAMTTRPAKPHAGADGRTALWASGRQGGSALFAKPVLGRILNLTARATHSTISLEMGESCTPTWT